MLSHTAHAFGVLVYLAGLIVYPQAQPAPRAPTVSAAPRTASAFVNPRGIQFDASLDHDAIANGVPLLTRYALDIYAGATPAATAVPITTASLGKPAPVSGVIAFMGVPTITASLSQGTYVAKVCAEGGGGRNCSVFTDPFDLTPPAPQAPGSKPTWLR
jgi:hypothetical protein